MKKVSPIYFHLSVLLVVLIASYAMYELRKIWLSPIISFNEVIKSKNIILDPLTTFTLALLPIIFYLYLLVYLKRLHTFYIDDNLESFLRKIKGAPNPVYVFFAYFFITGAIKYILGSYNSSFGFPITVISVLVLINQMILEKTLVWIDNSESEETD